MNQAPSRPLPHLDRATLGRACLRHLEEEATFLERVREALRELRAALLRSDLEALRAALHRQTLLTQAGEDLGPRRARLWDDLAAAFSRPAGALTLRQLSGHFPDDVGQRLDGCRQRLHGLMTEIQTLNGDNAALTRQALKLIQQLLIHITGAEPAGGAYSSRGTPQEVTCGPLIEARG